MYLHVSKVLNMKNHSSLLLTCFVSLSLLACKADLPAQNDDASIPPPVATVDTLLYLALGDSYTIGESVAPSERWPVQLADAINQLDTSLHIGDVNIIAQTGWTTGNLINALALPTNEQLEADVVSLLIGVNNQYQGLDTAQYRAQLSELIQYALGLVNGQTHRVFIVSIPDYGYTPFGQSNQTEISSELAVFNQICLEEAVIDNVPYYNITPISQEWPNTPGLVAQDGLHPSGVQYARWVESFSPQVAAQLLSH